MKEANDCTLERQHATTNRTKKPRVTNDKRSQLPNTKGTSVAKNLRPSRLSLRRLSASSRSRTSRSWSGRCTIPSTADSSKSGGAQVAVWYGSHFYTMSKCHPFPRKMEQVFVLHALWSHVRPIHNLMRTACRSPCTYAPRPGLRAHAQVGQHQRSLRHAMSYKTPATVEQIF